MHCLYCPCRGMPGTCHADGPDGYGTHGHAGYADGANAGHADDAHGPAHGHADDADAGHADVLHSVLHIPPAGDGGSG